MPLPYDYIAQANYIIYFTDEDEYNFALSTTAVDPYIWISPQFAMDYFGITYTPGETAANKLKGLIPIAPYALTKPGTEILHPGPSGVFMDNDLQSGALVPGQANSQGVVGGTMLLLWVGKIIYMPFVPDGIPATPPRRRFIWTPNLPMATQRGATGNDTMRSRDAGRTIDDIGFAHRRSTNVLQMKLLEEYNPFSGTGLDTGAYSWERIYVRPREIGSAEIDIWRAQGTPSTNAGCQLRIRTDLSLRIYNITSFSAYTNVGTSAAGVLTQNAFNKIDILLNFNQEAVDGNGRVRVFVKGILVLDITVPRASGGMGEGSLLHLKSTLGSLDVGANTWDIDYTDWHNAAIPATIVDPDTEALTSNDWILGTHIHLTKWSGLNSTKVGWTGDLFSLDQLNNPLNVSANAVLTSSTALSKIDAESNVNPISPVTGISVGILSVQLMLLSKLASGTAQGRLGMKFSSGPLITYLQTIAESNAAALNDVLYAPHGWVPLNSIDDPQPGGILPVSSVYEKANNGILATVYAMQMAIEMIGMWGPEDDPESDLTGILLPIHNAPYPYIAQAFLGPAGDGPVLAVGGTYVGTGTSVTTSLNLPAHWIWIRAVGVANVGAKWWSTMMGSHAGGQEGIIPSYVVRCDYDVETGLSSFTVVGSDAQVNANGTTYQYIAFCDPGYMFNLCGSCLHAAAVTTYNNPLFDSIFEPEAGWFIADKMNNSSNIRLYFKGSGITGTVARRIDDGSSLANAASFSEGVLVTGASLHTQGTDFQIAFSLWRSVNACNERMLQIFNYTGDGTASRVIVPDSVSGRCALLICVQPNTGAAMITKDPSDVGNSSRNAHTNVAITTGITAVGVDQFTVGSTLNANGVVYSVFIILGDDTSFINGEFYPSNCGPDGLIEVPIEPPPDTDINIIGNGGLILGGETALTLLKDVSGIYTIVPGKTNDTLYDRQTGQTEVDVKIPNPKFGTGYIGG